MFLRRFFVFASLLLVVGMNAAPRDAQWAEVEKAANLDQPQTAIGALEPIIAGAIADQAYAEATKAIARRIALEGRIQGGLPHERITRLEAELAKAPPGMKAPLETLLARWYWDFFQHNRWRFLQRTQTGAAAGADIQAWDLARILTEIDARFTAALAHPSLKETPIAAFDALLERGNVPDVYRPTVFDFVAHEALRFYTTGEQGAVRAEDAFEVAADSPIFAPAAEFLRWQPVTTDESAPQLKAIRLYQELLRFHANDRDRSAWLDVDLARLTFAANTAVGEDKDDRARAALQRLADENAQHEISARALAALARLHVNADDRVTAHRVASRGLQAFPDSVGAAECYNLIQQIEAKSAQLSTEFVWTAPWPTLDVTYRNVTRVHFRAVRLSFEDDLRRARWNLGQIDHQQANRLVEERPVLEWSAELPATTDYRERTESVPAPSTLAPGYYAILASHDPAFGRTENQLSVAAIWVSKLALVLTTRADLAPDIGFVLDAASGEPVRDATVRLWRMNNQGRFDGAGSTTTDQHGRFTLPRSDRQLVMLAQHDGHAVSSIQPIYSYGRNAPGSSGHQTIFFTDRALYRPGQSIHFKGIVLEYDQPGASYRTLPRQRVEVVFNDPNGQEIARTTATSNDYGSFSGVFTAPRDRLAGRMSLSVTNGPSGHASFSVEEYKRPKFEVLVEAPREAAKLAAPVKLTLKAGAYTGAAIGGAKVKWRVTRATRLPRWCWWWQPPATVAIAHGTAVTAADGTSEIEFTASPDRTVPEKLEPVFSYTLTADITDSAGETRSSSRTIQVGYTALQAELTSADWQVPDRPVEIRVHTSSLDGDPQAASGTVTVHALQQPERVARPRLQENPRWWRPLAEEPPADPSKPDSWTPGREVALLKFTTDAAGSATLSTSLPAGIYRATLETSDRFGKRVTTRHTIEVIDPASSKYAIKVPSAVNAPEWTLEPGRKFTAVWGTGYDSGRAFVQLESGGRILKSYWTAPGRTQETIELPVTEEMRGGVTLHVFSVRENRASIHRQSLAVPWTTKQLALKWESFRSKLFPGQPETWTAILTGPDAERAAGEMVAALYDASLDQFQPHSWLQSFPVFRQEGSSQQILAQNAVVSLNPFHHAFATSHRAVAWQYRHFSPELVGYDDVLELSPFSVGSANVRGGARRQTLYGSRLKAAPAAAPQALAMAEVTADAVMLKDEGSAIEVAPPASASLDQVTARRNLNETAFFFPHLLAGKDGTVKIEFTMPEALTRWKFLGFAHDQDLRSAFLGGETVTAKDLMVQPNAPRFVREGDTIEFTVKVTNQSDRPQSGRVRLTFADAATLAGVDAALANRAPEQAFEIPAKEERSLSWRITIPDGMGFLTYKAVGAAGNLSDGEEGHLPVLSRRILVTESLPLPIRGAQTKQFDFAKLLDSGKSSTLQHQALTVQMTSQPAWYAVLALPYLMEYPYECSEQLFNRLYANTLARHIAGSNPKIRRVFDLWKGTPALDSPLTKNEDLKSVLLEETPWLRQANRESESRRNVGLLFDANRLDQETARALQQLADRQGEDGLWSWFPGGRPNEYISLYILTGFGRLRNLGVRLDAAPAVKSLAGVDAWMTRRYAEIQRSPNPENYVPGSLDALYLYGRSFFLKDSPIASEHRVAVDFFLAQARKFWTKSGPRQTQAHLALALQRFGDKDTPALIVRSLKERSVTSEELGRFWRDTELSWWWYHAPIETQAMMIEVFAEVARDEQAVEDCKVWLLKQKQTQDWKTTKATADAVYGLLLRGANLLASDKLVEVTLGDRFIQPENVEAGTGFYERKFVREEIKPEFGRVTVKKVDDGVSWGSVHWQYLEDIAKVTPHEATPLTLKKALFIKETTSRGPVLKPVTGAVAVGDELVVRLELRTDRDMEYVHLKDQRGSGTEPVNVLSRYQYQDGLAYYESTRDTASHFFIDFLPKGTYVFEYSTRVQLKGSYQSGIAEIQCMYAPEFNSHSASTTIEVK